MQHNAKCKPIAVSLDSCVLIRVERELHESWQAISQLGETHVSIMSDDNLNALRCPIASQMSMNALILERGRGGEKAYLEKERAPGAQGRSGAGTFSHGMPYIISLVSFARVAIDVLTACATVRPQFPPSFSFGTRKLSYKLSLINSRQLSCNSCSRLTRTRELRKLSYKLSLGNSHQLSCNSCSRLTRTWYLRKLSYKLPLVNSHNSHATFNKKSIYTTNRKLLIPFTCNHIFTRIYSRRKRNPYNLQNYTKSDTNIFPILICIFSSFAAISLWSLLSLAVTGATLN